jgi:type III secretion protein J
MPEGSMKAFQLTWVRTLAGAGLALLLAACGEQDLYSQLSQRQANEMTSVLRSAGVEAEKKQRDGGTFAVVAPRDSFSQAMEVLRAHGLPRDGHESLGQVFKKEGFGSSPIEDRARLNYALSQEIANTLSSIDGVITARVHLALPERDPLADKPLPSSASVFIKHRAGVDLQARVGNIKALVVNALPSLPYDNVTVALFQAEALPLRAAAPQSLGGLGTLLSTVIGLGVLALLAGAGLMLWQRRKDRLATAAPAEADDSANDDSVDKPSAKVWALLSNTARKEASNGS